MAREGTFKKPQAKTVTNQTPKWIIRNLSTYIHTRNQFAGRYELNVFETNPNSHIISHGVQM